LHNKALRCKPQYSGSFVDAAKGVTKEQFCKCKNRALKADKRYSLALAESSAQDSKHLEAHITADAPAVGAQPVPLQHEQPVEQSAAVTTAEQRTWLSAQIDNLGGTELIAMMSLCFLVAIICAVDRLVAHHL
jgi:hypothetical protein